MKVRFRPPYLLSLQNVSSFSVLGVLLGRFSSIYIDFWNPCQSWGFAAVERVEQGGFLVSCKEQWEQFKKWHPRGKRRRRQECMGPASQRVKPRLRTRELDEKGSHQMRGRMGENGWTVGVVTRKLWETDTWDARRSMLGRSRFRCASCPTKIRKPGCWQGMEMAFPEDCCCQIDVRLMQPEIHLSIGKGHVPKYYSSFQ